MVVITETEQKDIEEGKHTTLCLDCNHTCHEVCIFGDDKDKIGCYAMDRTGHCRVCKDKCHWERHRNARFIIVCKEVTKWVIPEDLIKLWNQNTQSLEGATLDAMKEYLNLQERLNEQIKILIELTEKLNNVALKHNPEALLNYLDMLVKDGRARGLNSSQLEALIKAKKCMQVAVSVKKRGRGGLRFYNSGYSVVDILHTVKRELERRSKLGYYERLWEESQHCDFYNRLRNYLPEDIRREAPSELRGSLMKSVTFEDNLKAIVKLLKVLLSKGIFEGQEFTF